jgi:hypothetical protein
MATGKLPPAEEAVRMAVLEPVPKAKPEPKRPAKESPPSRPFRAEMLKRFGGDMKEPPRDPEGAPMRKGGTVSTRADGCAVRGKTKGKMVVMV